MFLKKKECQIAKLGEEVLRQEAKEVKDLNSKEIKSLIKKMLHCVKLSRGVGLAAPQIFESYQILIISSHPNDRYPNAPLLENEILINPKILNKSETLEKGWEGCLSIPGIRALVPRYKTIEVEYTKIDGSKIQIIYEDFLARIFQHEYDHLIGKVFLDRVETNSDIISEDIYFKKIK
ncbi:peptide deformylase [Halarcobacter mediterraneus]|uniref:Peptide deformylase n=1 Tax=Halarcobacter mediterraneus TaxID=2023153 RepID=A0A4Q1AU56_9BACT|nr:peptide deformylase [Halarcobacter mediterraneus]RXK12070.1 peptide deformylase [Halarcobacter mediterraneus]